jgi:hypothetical protein
MKVGKGVGNLVNPGNRPAPLGTGADRSVGGAGGTAPGVGGGGGFGFGAGSNGSPGQSA